MILVILIAAQLLIAFLGAPQALALLPLSAAPLVFLHAIAYALIMWLVGLAASFALKWVHRPGVRALGLALVLALSGAALITFAPGLLTAIPVKFPQLYVPLIGALIGYHLGR